jgi:hypothetical protein
VAFSFRLVSLAHPQSVQGGTGSQALGLHPVVAG